MSGDSCNDNSQIFVFFGSISNEIGLSIKTVGSKGSEECNQRCLTPTGSFIRVQNCQVHLYSVANNTSPDLSGTVNLFCLACQPGFKATEFHLSNHTISKCEAIAGCDTAVSGGQKWMNQCHQCQTGKAWAWDQNEYKIDFSQCVDLPSEFANCAVLGSDGCLSCLSGYALTSDFKCSDQNNCGVLGNGGFGFMRKTEHDKSLQIRSEIGTTLNA